MVDSLNKFIITDIDKKLILDKITFKNIGSIYIKDNIYNKNKKIKYHEYKFIRAGKYIELTTNQFKKNKIGDIISEDDNRYKKIVEPFYNRYEKDVISYHIDKEYISHIDLFNIYVRKLFNNIDSIKYTLDPLFKNMDSESIYKMLDRSQIFEIYVSHFSKYGKQIPSSKMFDTLLLNFPENLLEKKKMIEIDNYLNRHIKFIIFYIEDELKNCKSSKDILKLLAKQSKSDILSDKERYELIRSLKYLVENYYENIDLFSRNITL